MTRRVLVTGATGFIGSHVTEALCEGGWTVRCLVRDRASRAWLEALDVEYAIGDVTHDAGLEDACSDCACVVHCAGVTNAVRERTFFDVNRDGTRRVRDAAANAGVERFVFVSSLAARGPRGPARSEASPVPHPVNAYGRSKLEAERQLGWRNDGVETVIVRAPAVYGPRDRDVLTLVRMALRGVVTLVHGDRQRLSLVHAADLARGIRLACERPVVADCLTIADGHDLATVDFVQAIARAAGSKVRLVQLPGAALWLAAAGGEVWGRLSGHAATLNFTRLSHFLGLDWTVGDDVCAPPGFEPRIDLDQGLAGTVTWYREAGWV